jgi:3-hydroxyacyl-[acyl-carrier-protein] dehydratase
MTSPPFKDVREVIPHRDPFLFIDRVVEMEGRRIVAVRTFRADEPFFQGHFPQQPVVPGVLLVEGLAQTMAYFALSHAPKGRVFLVGIDRARFRSVVSPGTEVTFEVEIGEERLGVLNGKGKVRAGKTRIADASLMGYAGPEGGPTA